VDIIKLIQPHLLNIQPYSTARDEYEGRKGIFLDANENSIGSVHEQQFNRYPDPHHLELKQALSKAKNISVDKIFVGNGSDEAIDLLIRLFCRPGTDSIIVCPPTYGMYAVSAAIHDTKVKEATLTDDFQLNLALIEELSDHTVKMIFLCSPNNPTGNLLRHSDVEMLLDNFPGIVVIDEAYIDFAKSKSWLASLHEYPNLVVLQTFSKHGDLPLYVSECVLHHH
jgi:histidinol-phosphate aminotransferase